MDLVMGNLPLACTIAGLAGLAAVATVRKGEGYGHAVRGGVLGTGDRLCACTPGDSRAGRTSAGNGRWVWVNANATTPAGEEHIDRSGNTGLGIVGI